MRIYVEQKMKIAAQMGHEVIVIAPDPSLKGHPPREEKRETGGMIVHMPSPPLIVDPRYGYFHDRQGLYRLLDQYDPDFLEVSSPWRSASFVAEWPGKAPRALFMHADPLSVYAYPWLSGIASREMIDRWFAPFWSHLRAAASQCDLVVCANPHLTQRLHTQGIQNAETIAFGVEPDIFSPSLRDDQLRRTLLARCHLPEDATLLIGVGRHSREKRWPMVIEACVQAGLYHKIGLILLGEGRQSAAIARAIGGNPHILLLAPVHDRGLFARILASCDGLIHGAESETFGFAVAEAVASGLPVIVPADSSVAILGQQGFAELYRAGDAASAAAAIDRMVRTLPSVRRVQATGKPVRTITTHFADLFARYADIIARKGTQ